MAQSGPEKKKETKESAKAEISLSSSSFEDLIYAYLEEGKLIAASYITVYLYEKHRKDQESIKDWQKKLEAKSWPSDADVQAFKKAKPNEFRKMLRKQTLLGMIYEHSPKTNGALALACYQRAADHKEPYALMRLAYFHSDGTNGLRKNVAEAIRLGQDAANLGEPCAQYEMGDLCEFGHWITIPRNEAEAVRWYQQSSEQGYIPALCRLGRMSEIGHGGLPKDIEKAASLYSRTILQDEKIIRVDAFYEACDWLTNLFKANQDHLLVAFYAAVAQCHVDQGYVNSLLHTSKRDKIIRQLNTLLINLTQSAEEKKDPAAIQQLHEFYKASYGVPHKILLSILTDKNNLERWEQYVLKQTLLEQRFSQMGSPMPQLGAHVLSFLGSMNPQQSADIKTAVAKHRKAPGARQHVELIQAVLKGEFDADVKLYKKLQTEVGKSKLKPQSGKQEIRDYDLLEKLIKEEGKKARSPIDLDVALGVLYYAAGDYKKAADQFLKASRAEDPRGYFHLGKMYENGHLFGKSDGAAKECYSKAAKLTEEMKAKGEVKHRKSDSPKR